MVSPTDLVWFARIWLDCVYVWQGTEFLRHGVSIDVVAATSVIEDLVSFEKSPGFRTWRVSLTVIEAPRSF